MMPWRPLSAAALIAVAYTGAQAAGPEWGLKATGLAGAPVADGEGHSARVTVEPTLKWKRPSVEIQGSVRLRWLDQQRDRRTDVDVARRPHSRSARSRSTGGAWTSCA
jgi:hypothetical protein